MIILDRLKEIIDKIPTFFLMVFYLLYLGFDYYTFNTSPASELNVNKKEIQQAMQEKGKLDKKLDELKEFVRTLDQKKTALGKLSEELDKLKGALPETLDVPNLMTMLVGVARESGLKVQGLKPLASSNSDKEYYSEQSFSFTCKGSFFKMIQFFRFIALNIAQIVRVDKFSLKPMMSADRGTNSNSLKEMSPDIFGELEIKAFKYLGSNADKIVQAAKTSGSVEQTVNSAAAIKSDQKQSGAKARKAGGKR